MTWPDSGVMADSELVLGFETAEQAAEYRTALTNTIIGVALLSPVDYKWLQVLDRIHFLAFIPLLLAVGLGLQTSQGTPTTHRYFVIVCTPASWRSRRVDLAILTSRRWTD